MKLPVVNAKTKIVVSVVLAVFVVAFLGSVAWGSTQSGCETCHEPQLVELEKSGHASTACLSCHLESGAWSYPAFAGKLVTQMFPSAISSTEPTGPVTPLAASACTDCHASVMKAAEPQTSRGLRILHKACAADSASCDSCHSMTAHGDAIRNPRAASMEECVKCHDSKGASKECDTCHAGKVKLADAGRGTFAITHGPDWEKTHGLGDLSSCTTCHASDSCVKCHGVVLPHESDFGSTHGTYAKADRKKCVQCHEKPSFCTDCHGIAMPHPPGFFKNHASIAETVENKQCQRCHEQTGCESCHVRHVHPGGAKGIPPLPSDTNGGGSE